MTKIKIALATMAFAATSSAAFAQGFDPNLANRYPDLAQPNTYGYVAGGNAPTKLNPAPAGTLQSAPVRLQRNGNARVHSAPVLEQRNVALPGASYPGAGERIPQNSDAWMLLNRRVPGNAGDTSYGGDWATTWGGP